MGLRHFAQNRLATNESGFNVRFMNLRRGRRRYRLTTAALVTAVHVLAGAKDSQAGEPRWELWSDTRATNGGVVGGGLPKPVNTMPRLAIAPNHDIFFTYVYGHSTNYGNGLVWKADHNGPNGPRDFALMTTNGFVTHTNTQQENVFDLTVNDLNEPVALLGYLPTSPMITPPSASARYIYRFNSALNQWAATGPPGDLAGNAYKICRNLDGTQLWFVPASVQGLYRSIDHGQSWALVAKNLPTNPPLNGAGVNINYKEFCLTFGPATPRHTSGLFTTVGESAGVLHSSDGSAPQTSVDPWYYQPDSPLARVHPKHSTPDPPSGVGDARGLGGTAEWQLMETSSNVGYGGADAVRMYRYNVDRPDLPALAASGIADNMIPGGAASQGQVGPTTQSGTTFYETMAYPVRGRGGIYTTRDGAHWTSFNAGIEYDPFLVFDTGSGSYYFNSSIGSLAVDGDDVFMATSAGRIFHYVDPGAGAFMVSGIVNNTNGAPVAGATVSTGFGQSAQTMADGSYTLGGLGQSRYKHTIRVSSPGLAFQPQYILVTGAMVNVNFDAQAAQPGSISVTTPYGQSAVGATGMVHFSAIIFDQYGNLLNPQRSITWSVSNAFGTIDAATGWFTAGLSSGAAGVIATEPISGVSGAYQDPVTGKNGMTVATALPGINGLSKTNAFDDRTDTLSIFGKGFRPGAPVPTVYIGLVQAGVISSTDTNIVCSVPYNGQAVQFAGPGAAPITIINNTTRGQCSLHDYFSFISPPGLVFGYGLHITAGLGNDTRYGNNWGTSIQIPGGRAVPLQANPPPAGQQFYCWSGGGEGAFVPDNFATNASFTMPTHPASIVATYKIIPSGIASPPVIVLNSNNATVALSSANFPSNALLYYTTDGSTPVTTSSNTVLTGTTRLYMGPFAVTNGTQVKAIAAEPTRNDSAVAGQMISMGTFTITASKVGYGFISPAGTISVPAGSMASFTNTPALWYHTDSIVVDSGNVETPIIYTFTNVSADHTIIATFNPDLAANNTPKWWLAQEIPDSTNNFDAAALADQDGDHLYTWQEYIAGTRPTDLSSVFAISITTNNGQHILNIQTTSTGAQHEGLKRYYTLESATHLVPALWVNVAGGADILGSGQTITYTNAPGLTNVFYRGKVKLAP